MQALTQQVLTFSMAARSAGIPERTLRAWLDRAILKLAPDDDRTEGNWRKFAVTDVIQIAVVARLAAYGVPIAKADGIYESVVGARLRTLARFKNTPKEAISAMLTPIEIGICHTVGKKGAVEYWQVAPDLKIDFEDDNHPGDYAIVPLGKIVKQVLTRVADELGEEAKKIDG